MGSDFWSGFAGTLGPQISGMALKFYDDNRQETAKKHQQEMEVLDYLSKSENPDIANRAVAGIVKKTREIQTGKSSSKKGGVLSEIFSPEFEQDEDFTRLRNTMDMVKQAHQAGADGAGGGAGGPGGGAGPGTPPPMPTEPPPASTMPPGFDPSSIPENIRAPELDQPAAVSLGGTSSLSPAAAGVGGGGVGAGTVQPPAPQPQQTVPEEVAGLGFKPSAMGYGPTGRAAVSSVLQGRETAKSRAANATALERATVGANSRSSEGQLNRDAAAARLDTRLQGQWDRLQEAERLRGKRPKTGSKSGINFEKESVEAAQHYSTAINTLESGRRAALSKVQQEAIEKDWDPATLSQTVEAIEQNTATQRQAIDQGYQKNITLIGRLAGGREAAGVGMGGAGASTAPPAGAPAPSSPPPGAGSTPPPKATAAPGAATSTAKPSSVDFPPNAPLGAKATVKGRAYIRTQQNGQLGWAPAGQ